MSMVDVMLERVPVCALRDRKLRERLAAVVAERGIRTIVETGLDKGGSTLVFAGMAEHVIGVDNMGDRVGGVAKMMSEVGVTNVRLVHQNSPDALRELIAAGLDASTTLFFLDAHWQKYWPLKDEIGAITRGHGVLVMHDARVPGCPGLGVDEYDGQELSYEYLRDVLAAWSPAHRVEYNDDTAEWPRRGVMIVYPS